jgi:hypothetical protein
VILIDGDMDFEADIWRSPPESLARLLASASGREGTWQPEELEVVLLCQLKAPAEFELGHALVPPEVRTLQDLFEHPVPPLELLRRTKDFAKAHLADPETTLSQEVAATFYYASICLAMDRHGVRITQLSNRQLSEGLRWCLAQPWMEAGLRRLFDKALCDLGVTHSSGKVHR